MANHMPVNFVGNRRIIMVFLKKGIDFLSDLLEVLNAVFSQIDKPLANDFLNRFNPCGFRDNNDLDRFLAASCSNAGVSDVSTNLFQLVSDCTHCFLTFKAVCQGRNFEVFFSLSGRY